MGRHKIPKGKMRGLFDLIPYVESLQLYDLGYTDHRFHRIMESQNHRLENT